MKLQASATGTNTFSTQHLQATVSLYQTNVHVVFNIHSIKKKLNKTSKIWNLFLQNIFELFGNRKKNNIYEGEFLMCYFKTILTFNWSFMKLSEVS